MFAFFRYSSFGIFFFFFAQTTIATTDEETNLTN